MIMGTHFGNIEKADFVRIHGFLFLFKYNYQKHLFFGNLLQIILI